MSLSSRITLHYSVRRIASVLHWSGVKINIVKKEEKKEEEEEEEWERKEKQMKQREGQSSEQARQSAAIQKRSTAPGRNVKKKERKKCTQTNEMK